MEGCQVDSNLMTIINLSNVLRGVSSVFGTGEHKRKIITISVDFSVEYMTSIHITGDHMRYFLKSEGIEAKFKPFQSTRYEVYAEFDKVRVFCITDTLDKFKPYIKLDKPVTQLVAQRDKLNAKIKASQEATP